MANFVSEHTGNEIDLSVGSGSTTSGVIKDFNTLSGSLTSTISIGGDATVNDLIVQNITASGDISASDVTIQDLTNIGIVDIQNTTAATNPSGTDSGALRVRGGMSIVKNISVGTNITASGDISASKVTIKNLTAKANLDIGSHDFRARKLTADNQTSGRVAIYGTNGLLTEDSDLSFSGDTLTATKITSTHLNVTHLTSSFVTSSTVTHDGNTTFGNSSDDTHQFTGHITASGNISASGNIITSGFISQSGTNTNIFGSGIQMRGGVFSGISSGGTTHTLFTPSDNLMTIGGLAGPNPNSHIRIAGITLRLDGDITASGNISGSSTSTINVGGNVTTLGSFIGDKLILGTIDTTDNTFISASDGNIKIAGDAGASGDVSLAIQNTDTGTSTSQTSTLKFEMVSNANAGKIVAGKDAVYAFADSNKDSNLQFYTAINGTDTERIRITSDGNVGVGNVSPTELLAVEGNISASGGVILQKTAVSSDAASSSGNLTSNNFSLSHTLTLDGNLADDAEHADVTITTDKCLPTSVVVGSASLKVQVFVHTVTNGSFKFFFVNKSGGTLADDSTIRFNFTIL